MADVEYFSRRDKELLIDPMYFCHLKTEYSEISRVEILPKFGTRDNEMNNYRYDVVLYINESTTNETLYFDNSDFSIEYDIQKFVQLNHENDVVLVKYPNKNICEDYSAVKKLYEENHEKIYKEKRLVM